MTTPNRAGQALLVLLFAIAVCGLGTARGVTVLFGGLSLTDAEDEEVDSGR